MNAKSLRVRRQSDRIRSRKRFLAHVEQLEPRHLLTAIGVEVITLYNPYDEGATLEFEFIRDSWYVPFGDDLTVNFTITPEGPNAAFAGSDYTPPSTFTVVIHAPDYFADVPIQTIDDSRYEPTEAIRVTITSISSSDPLAGYFIQSSTDVAYIPDNDTPLSDPLTAIPGCPFCPPPIYDIAHGWGNDPSVANFSEAPSGYSTAPVRYFDGTVLLAFDDLQSNGFGMPWGISRQWTNGVGYYRQNIVGDGMVISQQPRLIGGDAAPTLGVITDGRTAQFFDSTGTGYAPRHFSRDELVYDSMVDEYFLRTPEGTEIRFFGYSNLLPFVQQGSFKSHTDSFGNVTEVVSHSAFGDIEEVQRSHTDGGGTTVESFLYEYVTTGVNQGMLAGVELRRKLNAGPWVTGREVEYSYYGTSDTYGNLNDLELATIKDGSANVIDQTYYRYYKGADPNGYQHAMQYVVGPQSFARLIAAEGGSLDSISSNDLAPFADYYFEYDNNQRAILEKAQGTGSTANGGLGQFTFSYFTSGNPDGYNSWNTKTIETLPDGNENIVFTNFVGQVMLEVFKDTTTSDEWLTYYQYDGDGRLVMVAHPSAVIGYDEYSADLLDFDTTDYTYLSDSEGLIKDYEYYTSTTATTGSAGDAEGYLKGVSIRNGESGAAVPQSLTTYIAATNGTMINYLPATSTVYTNANGTGALTTSFQYTFYSSSLRIESLETTTTAADVSRVFYDEYGNPVWTKDAEGYLHYAEFDVATGAVVKTITDVDDSETLDFSGLPGTWSTPGGGGTHAITTYEVDGQGRTTTETDAEGRVTYAVYDDENHEVRIYAGWDTGTDAPTGPTLVIREDRAGNYLETLSMSAAPNVAGDRPTGTEAISSIASLTRDYFNSGGQADHSDAYFLIAGLTYTVGTSLGVEGTNFYRASYAYDERGRPNRTLRADGTIFRSVFDGLGRLTSEWIGDGDIPAMGDWSPVNPADMEQVAAYEYDGGNVGDSLLTLSADGLLNETTYEYDFRGRLIESTLADPDAGGMLVSPAWLYAYDNLNRVIEATDPLTHITTWLYEDNDRRVTVTQPDPDDGGMLVSPEIVNLYDALGRLLSTTDPNGNETTNTFDGLGLLVSTTQSDPDDGGPLSQPVTDYEHDKVGNLLILTDPVGNATTWTYDAINRVESETNQLNKARTFEYDTAGNLFAKVDRLDRRMEYEYDALGRRTSELWYESLSLVHTINFDYDAASRLTEANDPAAVNFFTYDNRDRATNEVMTFDGFLDTITLDSQYDAAGNRTQTVWDFGTTESLTSDFEYDGLNRLSKLTRSSDEQADFWHRAKFSYNELNQFLEISRFVGDNTTPIAVADTEFEYDGMNRLSSILHTTGMTTWAGYDYTYDDASRITSIDSYLDGLSEYIYDATNQLIGADHAIAADESYDYDENGNRDTGYTTGTNNQLLSDGTFDFTYDDEGNRATRTNIATGYVTQYTWDHRNRLIKVIEFDDEENELSSVSNSYDSFNRWIRQSEDSDGPGGSAAVDTYFAYEGNQLTLEFAGDDGGDLSHIYSWGPSVDELIADIVHGETPTFALTDHLGTVRDFVEYDAGMADTVDTGHRIFDSFGNITSQIGISSLIGFTGRPFDETTGLQNNLNRWYDPVVGRWVSEDPIGFAGDRSNISRYVCNSPVQNSDPLGLAPSAQEPVLPSLTPPLVPSWFLPSLADQSKWEYLYSRFGDYYWRYIEYWWPGAFQQYTNEMDRWTKETFDEARFKSLYKEKLKEITAEIRLGIRPPGNAGALAIKETAEHWKKIGGGPVRPPGPKPVLKAPTFKTMMKYAKEYWDDCLNEEENAPPPESPNDV